MKFNILLLCNKPEQNYNANTIVDHIESFTLYSRSKIWTISNLGDLPSSLNLDAFDVIIVHYSLSLLNTHYLSSSAKERLKKYTGLKVLFLQDEYRAINKMIEEINNLDVDVLFTCFPNSEMNRIYPKEKLNKLSIYNNLTGYIPDRLHSTEDIPLTSQRKLHVGYRARKLPFWYGELGYEKWNIVKKWKEHVADSLLATDLSYKENDRIYGKKWISFLKSCKTTLGVESGASVMDFTGELEEQTELYQLMHPRESFENIQARFLKKHEGLYKLNQISPRCFEAIALKTVLVLYEGEYSGILNPNHHFIELKKDFSNIHQVISLIKNDNFLQTMANRTYEEIALNPEYSYKHFIQQVDDVIEKEFSERYLIKRNDRLTEGEFQEQINKLSYKAKFLKKLMYGYQRLPAHFRVIIRYIVKPSILAKQVEKKTFSFFDRIPVKFSLKLKRLIKIIRSRKENNS